MRRPVHLLFPKGLEVSFALTSLGWDERFAAEFSPYADTHVVGRVARVDRGAADIITVDNPVRVALRATDEQPAVGDWVALAATADRRWVVDVVLPRRTALSRAAVSGESAPQVLAANVDLVLVVIPAVPEPRPGMAERMLALAWDSGAQPLVVATKCDLTPDADAVAQDIAETAPGVEVVRVVATRDGGVTALEPWLTPGRTLCLLGRSGAGKSTLGNALAGEERFATTEIRSDGKGRHTTTHRELAVLPSGAVLIDTPGLRGVGLWLSEDGLDRAFADVETLSEQCRFADCLHRAEPGCAVLAAIDDGTLAERRWESWQKLQREVRWMASRTDARLRAEQRQRWKVIHKEVRRSGRIRP